MKAALEIRIWSDAEQPDDGRIGEMLRRHAEHVANMLGEGFLSGDIVDDDFRGWWEIKT